MNVEFSANQIQAIGQGAALPLTLEGTPCVVVRRDVYERFAQAVSGELDADTVYQLITESMAESDANDPSFDSYQRYKQ